MPHDELSPVERVLLEGLRRADPDAVAALASLDESAQRRVLEYLSERSASDETVVPAAEREVGATHERLDAGESVAGDLVSPDVSARASIPGEQSVAPRQPTDQIPRLPTVDTVPDPETSTPESRPADASASPPEHRPRRRALAFFGVLAIITAFAAIAYVVSNLDGQDTASRDTGGQAGITTETREPAGTSIDTTPPLSTSTSSITTEAPEPGNAAAVNDDRVVVTPTEVGRISAGYDHSCGVRTIGNVTCWGSNDYGQVDPPAGTFSIVSSGLFHTCGLRTNGAVTCWGSNDYGEADAPAGTFSVVSSGLFHTCGLRTNGAVTCWGSNTDRDGNYFGQADPPVGRFTAVSAGDLHSCGLRTNGTVICWGSNDFGEADAPAGTFIVVSAGSGYSCGLRTNGTVICWGSNDFGEADAPAGTFSVVSSGLFHTCGLRTNGAVTCWGSNTDWDGNYFGQANPPAGRFTAVSAGYFHSCGLLINGGVRCWGANESGQVDAPAGTFNVPIQSGPTTTERTTTTSRQPATTTRPASGGACRSGQVLSPGDFCTVAVPNVSSDSNRFEVQPDGSACYGGGVCLGQGIQMGQFSAKRIAGGKDWRIESAP